jgi:hypothetical protein
MPTYHIWERGVYKAKDVDAEHMRDAVRSFAGVHCVILSGSAWLSTKANSVRWIASNGTAREFTAYEVLNENTI